MPGEAIPSADFSIARFEPSYAGETRERAPRKRRYWVLFCQKRFHLRDLFLLTSDDRATKFSGFGRLELCLFAH